MTTCTQTVELTLPQSSLTFYSIEEAPIPPLGYPIGKGFCYSIITENNAIICWDYDRGVITKTTEDGTIRRWWPRPTLANAIRIGADPAIGERPFFQFHGDGSITAHCYGSNYYWSAEYPSAREHGRAVENDRCNCSECRYEDNYY